MNNQYIITLLSGFTDSYNSDSNNSGNTLYFAYGDRMKTGDISYYNQLYLPTSYETNIVYENGVKTYTYNIAPEFHIKMDNPESEVTSEILSLLDNYQINLENLFRANFSNKTYFNSLSTTDFKNLSPDITYARLINVTLIRKENYNNVFNTQPTIIPFKNAILKNIESITQPSGNTSMQINISDGSFYNIELPDGSGSTGKTITNITQPSGDTSMSVNYTDNTFDIIDLPIGPMGLTGQSGTSVSSITQSNVSSMTVNLSNNTSYNINLPKGDTGTSGVSISSVTQTSGITSAMTVTLSNGNTSNILLPTGPNSLSFLINQPSYLDHMFAGNTNNTTELHSFTVRTNGTATNLNTFTIGLGGQIQLSTGSNTTSDIVIRKNGLSGFQTLSQTREYHTGIWFGSLYNATNSGNFIFAIQNDFTPTLTSANRTGIYVTISWNSSVSANTFTLQSFNNGVSSTIVDTTPVLINTLYAIKVLSNTSNTQLFVNGSLLLQLSTNIPTFTRIQPGVGLTKTSGTSPVVCNVDYIGTFMNQSTNTYII